MLLPGKRCGRCYDSTTARESSLAACSSGFRADAAGYSRGVETAGKLLLGAALILAILGVGALALSKLGIDRLPATLTWRSDNVTVFVPIGLMVVASIVGTIVLNIFLRR